MCQFLKEVLIATGNMISRCLIVCLILGVAVALYDAENSDDVEKSAQDSKFFYSDRILFHLFRKSNLSNPQLLDVNNPQTLAGKINPGILTLIFVGGQESSSAAEAIKNHYLEVLDVNYIVADTSEVPTAIQLFAVSSVVANFVKFLQSNTPVQFELLGLVGHDNGVITIEQAANRIGCPRVLIGADATILSEVADRSVSCGPCFHYDHAFNLPEGLITGSLRSISFFQGSKTLTRPLSCANKGPALPPEVNMELIDPAKISFQLYRRATINKPYRLFNNSDNLRTSNFDPSLPTNVFIHGYGSSFLNPPAQKIKNSFLGASDCNVILVDYSSISFPYLDLFLRLRAISKTTADLINFLLEDGGLRIELVRVIGHSMGGQMTSFVCKYMNQPCPVIIALDPAAPCFIGVDPEDALSPDDSAKSICMHTSDILGISRPVCTHNFFISGGSNQPSCRNAGLAQDFLAGCDHNLAPIYYALSIQYPKLLVAQRCSSVLSAKYFQESCVSSPESYASEQSVVSSQPGIFYVPVSLEAASLVASL